MFSRDEMQRAIEDALKSMEGVALELYRRGREEAREELETVKRERDEARAECDSLSKQVDTLNRNCTTHYEHGLQLRRWLDETIDQGDEARAEVERLRAEAAPMNEHFAAGYRDGARDAYRRGAEAMREACARWMSEREGIAQWVYDDALSALPIPEEP